MNFLGFLQIAGFLILILIGIITFAYFVYFNKRNEEDPMNAPEFENFMPQYSEGHASGVVKDIQIFEKRIRIDFYPRDINYIKEITNNEDDFTPKVYSVFFDRKQVEIYSQGSFSMHITKIKGYPSDISLLPEEVKEKCPEILHKINKNNELKDESNLMQQRMMNLQKVSEEVAGGKIFTKTVSKYNEILKDVNETIKKDERKSYDPQAKQ